MAEAVRDAKTEEDRSHRIADLVVAAHNSARVADQLLSLERLKQSANDLNAETFDLGESIRDVCAETGPAVLARGVEFSLNAEPISITGDRVFVEEAVKNLIQQCPQTWWPRTEFNRGHALGQQGSCEGQCQR